MSSINLERACDATANGGYSNRWTFSAWVKRGVIGTEQGLFANKRTDNNTNSRFRLRIKSTNKLCWEIKDSSGSDDSSFETNMLFKDINAWYHIVFIYDSDNSTETDRMKCYVNGKDVRTELGGFASVNEVGSGFGSLWSSSVKNYLGVSHDNSGNPYRWDGLMSHVHFTYGYRYEASTFGSTDSGTGEWDINPSPSVTYGSQGFWLFKDNASVTDQSGQSNNFTLNAGTLTKTEDNPSNIFATINTLLGSDVIGSTVEYSSGNTIASDPNGQASGINPNFISTLGMPSKGKWYCEVQPTSFSTSSGHSIGIYRTKGSTDDTGLGDLEGNNSKIRYIYADTAIYIIKYGTNDQTGLTSISSGQTVGMALDLDNGTLQYYVDGSARANAITGINSANDGYDYFFHAGLESSSSGRYGIYKFNFGNGAFGSTQLTGTTYQDSQGRGIFKHQPPTNFLALCTKNLNV